MPRKTDRWMTRQIARPADKHSPEKARDNLFMTETDRNPHILKTFYKTSWPSVPRTSKAPAAP
jgi:hypothetical protein